MGLTDLLKSKKRLQQEQEAVERIAAVADMEVKEVLNYLPASLVYERETVLKHIFGKVGDYKDSTISQLSKTQKLLRKNPNGLVALVEKYEEHTWGLLKALGNNAVKVEKRKKYNGIIQKVKNNADYNAGFAFQYLEKPVMRKYKNRLLSATNISGRNTSHAFKAIHDIFYEDKHRRRSNKEIGGFVTAVFTLVASVGLTYSYLDGKSTYKEAWDAFTDDVSEVSYELRDVKETIGSKLMALVGEESSDPSTSVYITSTPEENAGINATIKSSGRFEFNPGERPNAPENRYGLEFYEDGELVFSSFSVEDYCNETSSSYWKREFECQKGDVEFSTVENKYYDLFNIKTTFPVEYTSPGEHTYFARVFDRQQTLDSDAEIVTFTGEIMDYPPTFSTFSFCDQEDENKESCKKGDLKISVEDVGDNPNLEKVVVYLNENELDPISTDETYRGETNCFDVVYVDTSTLDLEQGDVFTAVVYDGAGQTGESEPLEVTVASKAPTKNAVVDEKGDAVAETTDLEQRTADDDATVEPEPVVAIPYGEGNTEGMAADILKELEETTPAEETGPFAGYNPTFDHSAMSKEEYKQAIANYLTTQFYLLDEELENRPVRDALKANYTDTIYSEGVGDITVTAFFKCTEKADEVQSRESLIFTFTNRDLTFRYTLKQNGSISERITGPEGRISDKDENSTHAHYAAMHQYLVEHDSVLSRIPAMPTGPAE